MGVVITFNGLKLYINMEIYYKYKIDLFRNVSTNRWIRENKTSLSRVFFTKESNFKDDFWHSKNEGHLKEFKKKKKKKKRLVELD